MSLSPSDDKGAGPTRGGGAAHAYQSRTFEGGGNDRHRSCARPGLLMDMSALRGVVVEDDADIRSVVRLLLESEGMKILGEAGDGIQAVEVVALHQPDFVVLDYLLPGRNGDKVAPLIKEVSPRSCIVACSALLEAVPDWADGFLAKDRVTDIAECVLRTCGGTAAAR